MKREKCAAALLLVLIAVSAWSTLYANRLCTNVELKLQSSESAAAEDNWPKAQQELEQALSLWLNSEEYTHIFIRHTEIDSCSDAFYDTLGALRHRDEEDFEAQLKKLRYHLESIASMEQVRLGNIF